MFDIIICEDNNYQRQQIEAVIKEEILNSKLECSIVLTTDEPELIIEYVGKNKNRTFRSH
jgi:two-component system response regulator AgrA